MHIDLTTDEKELLLGIKEVLKNYPVLTKKEILKKKKELKKDVFIIPRYVAEHAELSNNAKKYYGAYFWLFCTKNTFTHLQVCKTANVSILEGFEYLSELSEKGVI